MAESLTLTERLSDAGIGREDAKAIAAVAGRLAGLPREDMVTKEHLTSELYLAKSALLREFGVSTAFLTVEMSKVKSESKADWEAARAELRQAIGALRGDLVRLVVGGQVLMLIVLVLLAKAHLLG